MFVLDMPPEVPQLDVPMMIVGNITDDSKQRVIGRCYLVSNDPPGASFSPVQSVNTYFVWYEQKEIAIKGDITLLKGPEHGELDSNNRGLWGYFPTDGYLGFDSATFLVEVSSYKVKLVYGFNVTPLAGTGTEGYNPSEDPKLCPNGEFWEISPEQDVIPLKRQT